MEQASSQERGFALAPALQEGQIAESEAGEDVGDSSDISVAYIRRLDVVNRGFRYLNVISLGIMKFIVGQRVQHYPGVENFTDDHARP